MRWEGGRKSDNVEDRRGQSVGRSAAGAAPLLLRFLPAMIRSKTGRVILVAGVIAIFGGKLLGIDVLGLFLGGGGAAPAQQSPEFSQQEQQLADFVSVVLADTEDTWQGIFREQGGAYREPTLVLFSGRVNSACGMASAAVGPFYCPGDQQLYIDLSFFTDLQCPPWCPGRFRPGVCSGPRGGSPCADPAGHQQAGAGGRAWQEQGRRSMHCRCGRSCRRTVSQVSGGMQRTASVSCWTRVTWRRLCGRRPQLATTACSVKPVARWCPTASPMAVRRSG